MGGVPPDGLLHILPEGHVVDQGVFDVRVVSSDEFIVAHVQRVSLREDTVFGSHLLGDHLLWEVL